MTHSSFDHDAHLIAVAQGDHRAFVRLYQHEAPFMMTLGTRMLGRDSEAREALKDTFILIWKHAESCDTSMTSARSWIYSIFRHRVMSTLRQPGRVPPRMTGLTDQHPADTPDQVARSPLHTALQQLDPAQRRSMLMAYYHGCSYRQIAAMTGSNTEHVQHQVEQGLRTIATQGQS